MLKAIAVELAIEAAERRIGGDTFGDFGVGQAEAQLLGLFVHCDLGNQLAEKLAVDAAGSRLIGSNRAADLTTQLLKTLGSEQRLLILCNLLEGELAVGELNERVDLSQSALSQHLAVLREAGLVTTRREAQSIFYSLPHGPVTQVMECSLDDLPF